MKTSGFAILAIVLLCSVVRAQDAQPGIHVSNDDPKWGEQITVSYTAETGSTFAKAGSHDTVFCAAMFYGPVMRNWLVIPMRHVTADRYEAVLVIPDSTYSVMLDLCTPRDRVPEGITTFTCRNREGLPAPGGVIETSSNIDSALSIERTYYPNNVSLFILAYDQARELEMSGGVHGASTMRMQPRAFIDSVRQATAPELEKHLTLAQLYSRVGDDANRETELRLASACTTFDPILNVEKFLQRFFIPVMRNGSVEYDSRPGRLLAPLASRFPHTNLGKLWLQREAYDSLVPVNEYKSVLAEWSNTNDVDLLMGIAGAFGYEKGPLHDPATSLKWLDRAEKSAATFAGFYSGENIWGGMDRLPWIQTSQIELLGALGRTKEAKQVAERALSSTEGSADHSRIKLALAKAYLDAGQLVDAEKAYAAALQGSTRSELEGLTTLYEKRKKGNESEKEYSLRIVKMYGKGEAMKAIPNFSFKTLDGKPSSLKAMRGKVVVLDFWFTTCGGCVVEKHSLNELVDSFNGDTNVVFLSVALDDESHLRDYLKANPFNFKVVPNGDAISKQLGITAYPTHILIGKDGKTLGIEDGGSPTEGEKMRPKIEEALKMKS